MSDETAKTAQAVLVSDLAIHACVPDRYTLGPFPVYSHHLIMKLVLPVLNESVTLFDAGIEKRSRTENTWSILVANQVLHKETLEFGYEPVPSERDEKFLENYRFNSLVEAKDFWYNTYLKSILTTCQSEDSGIHGVWTLTSDGKLATQKWDATEPVEWKF